MCPFNLNAKFGFVLRFDVNSNPSDIVLFVLRYVLRYACDYNGSFSAVWICTSTAWKLAEFSAESLDNCRDINPQLGRLHESLLSAWIFAQISAESLDICGNINAQPGPF